MTVLVKALKLKYSRINYSLFTLVKRPDQCLNRVTTPKPVLTEAEPQRYSRLGK